MLNPVHGCGENTVMIHKAKPTRPVSFPEWVQFLHADDTLSPGLQETYHSIIGAFLGFCKERRVPANIKLAQEFVELRQLERAPEPRQPHPYSTRPGHQARP